jgi:hypothetical protein
MTYNPSNKWRFESKVPKEAPQGYKARELEAIRYRAGRDIYKILLEQKLPAVVDIEEKSETRLDNFTHYGELDVFTIEVTITPVEHRHVTLAHHYQDVFAPFRRKPTLREQVTKWIKKLIRR